MIVVDSREQCPFPFTHERYEAKTEKAKKAKNKNR